MRKGRRYFVFFFLPLYLSLLSTNNKALQSLIILYTILETKSYGNGPRCLNQSHSSRSIFVLLVRLFYFCEGVI